jgi:protein-tyrosine-phosphatase
LAREILAREGLAFIETFSAGTSAGHGSRATEEAREVAREKGLDLEGFRSRPLTREGVESADLILVMEPRHRTRVLNLCPSADTRTHLLGAFAGGEGPSSEIPDPFGGTVEIYRSTLEKIEKHLRAGLDRIRQLAPRRSDSSA